MYNQSDIVKAANAYHEAVKAWEPVKQAREKLEDLERQLAERVTMTWQDYLALKKLEDVCH